jgi:hypothetical protein
MSNYKMPLDQCVLRNHYACEVPKFTGQSVHKWRSSCQTYDHAALYFQEEFWYSLLLETEYV